MNYKQAFVEVHYLHAEQGGGEADEFVQHAASVGNSSEFIKNA